MTIVLSTKSKSNKLIMTQNCLPTRRMSRRPFFLRSTKKFMWTCFSSDSLGKKCILSKPVDKAQARGRHTSSTVLSTTNSRHFWRHLTLLDWSGAVQWEVLTPQDVKLKWNWWGVNAACLNLNSFLIFPQTPAHTQRHSLAHWLKALLCLVWQDRVTVLRRPV